MNTAQKNVRSSDEPKKKKNPEPGKQKPLTVEKEHIVEDPKKGKRERIISKASESGKISAKESTETNGIGSIGLNPDR